MTLLVIVAASSLVIALVVTPWIRLVATRKGIGDYPSVRKVHKEFIPRLGGAGIIIAFSGGLAIAFVLDPKLFQEVPFDLWGVAIALCLVALLGAFDDIKGIGSLGKLIIQFLAASIVISAGLKIEYVSLPFVEPIHLGLFSIPLTLLWLVGVTNAVNLLDGLDGLAAGVVAIVSATVFCIGAYTGDALLTLASIVLISACVGFLRYNFHPASIFMGDLGSLFLGFLLACLSLRVIQHFATEVRPISLLVAVVTLAVPIVDTAVAFFRRVKLGIHPLKADKEHIHHRLMDLGFTHRQTVVSIYAISMINGFLALLLIFLDSLYSTILLVTVFTSVFLGIRRLGYIEEMRVHRGEESPPIRPLSVARIIDRTVLVIGDVSAIIFAFLFSYWFRFNSGFLPLDGFVQLEAYVSSPAILLLTMSWLGLFTLAGLYEIPWDVSRIDYGLSIVKTVVIGTIILFFITLDLETLTFEGRLTTLVYGASIALFVVFIRMMIVGVERKHEILGFRRRNTIVIGTSKTAESLLQEMQNRPGLKYNVIGFVDPHPDRDEFLGLPVLGNYERIPNLVKEQNVEEILIATKYDSREEILDVVARCNGIVPDVKVAPESLSVLSGFKIEEIIGHPLIRLYQTNLRTWQRITKRLVDIAASLLVLIPLLPVWIVVGVLIKLSSPGPVFFMQERVGKKGKIFRLIKFRSMIHNAEKETGPVWASPDDVRITAIGRVLRKLRLDEVPQFINVLKGEMSLIGPRPERPFFVEQLKAEVHFYTRRLLVRPGITGWAQVKLRYDTSLEDVKQKIKYDLYYLENMSLTLDFKILLRTIVVALSGKGTH